MIAGVGVLQHPQHVQGLIGQPFGMPCGVPGQHHDEFITTNSTERIDAIEDRPESGDGGMDEAVPARCPPASLMCLRLSRSR